MDDVHRPQPRARRRRRHARPGDDGGEVEHATDVEGEQAEALEGDQREVGSGSRHTKRQRRHSVDSVITVAADDDREQQQQEQQQQGDQEHIHRSLRQLEIDLGRVKELIKGERYKSYKRQHSSSVSPMRTSASETALESDGLVRRRHNGSGGEKRTHLESPPAMVVTSAHSAADYQEYESENPQQPRQRRPRTHHYGDGGGGGGDHHATVSLDRRGGGGGRRHHHHHHTTLAVISLDSTPVHTDEDNETAVANAGTPAIINGKHFLIPPSHRETYGSRSGRSPVAVSDTDLIASARAAAPRQHQQHYQAHRPMPTPQQQRHYQPGKSPADAHLDGTDGNKVLSEYCCVWPLSLLNDKPVVRLFIVMFLNGLLSMACSAAIMEIEKPEQIKRMGERAELEDAVNKLHANLTAMIERIGSAEYDSDAAVRLLDAYAEAVPALGKVPDEIRWEMLNAQAFITSVQTTTGYGDIIPVTSWGKLFTVLYAFVGIPVFMWYIVKLGALFRLIVMKLFYGLLVCLFPGIDDVPPPSDEGRQTPEHFQDVVTSSSPDRRQSSQQQRPISRARRMSTLTRIRLLDLNMRLKQQYYSDKRFHPMVIGTILVVFLASVAAFISYMENISYFDSFYAAFITYSTIGFGDIDIFKISYRSSWFHLLIYGNFIHIAGYMILSAWVSSLLEKCGVRKY